jgi:mono/diheme cytochrome c family protein
MQALHQAGGTPPGWKLTPPPGDPGRGRETFVELGCQSCHLVRGEDFASGNDAEHVGPELTGMGSHHPAAYFVEAILNPNAVLIDGPGYVDEQGLSRMPAYPELTLAQLADLVAYLRSLTGDGTTPARRPSSSVFTPRPKPPEGGAAIYYVQVYDIREGELEAFEQWFAAEGARALLAQDGLVDVETYVDNTRPAAALVTMMGFRDDEALGRFLQDETGVLLKHKWDEFIGPHGHQVFRIPPVYRVGSLSAP